MSRGDARSLVALLTLALGSGCSGAPADRAATGSTASDPVQITVLYTTDEHGWLLPNIENGRVRGGAASLLARLVAEEKHCPGRLPADDARWRAAAPPCPDASTILLSGGDNWTGPAISSYFGGEPMAAVMARLGYAASAFGN